MQPSISFRPLKRADFLLFQEWPAAPHVATWWNEPNDLAIVESKYGQRVDGAEPTHAFLIQHGSRPIRWIQWYLWADYPNHRQQLGAKPASAGIDLAIGEVNLIGLGLGPKILGDFLESFIFVSSSIGAVFADPEQRNMRSSQAFRKAGFQFLSTVQLASEDCIRQVMCRERPLP